MSEKIFVYGTLMSDQSNHFYLNKEGVKFLGKGKVDGFGLYNVTPYYPGVIKEKSESVLGEVYEVPEECLREIDRLEGNGSLYLREKTSAVLEDGSKVEDCWIYIWLHKVRPETKVPLEWQPWQRPGVCNECWGEGGWYCDDCGDEDESDCSECDGEGWIVCPKCGGRGFVFPKVQTLGTNTKRKERGV